VQRLNNGGASNIDKIRYKYGRYSDWDPADRHHGIQIDIFGVDVDVDARPADIGLGWDDAQEVIFPLRDHLFEDFQIMIPNDTERYFQLWLGEPYPSLLPLEECKPHEGRISFDVPPLWKEKYPELYPSTSDYEDLIPE
jgi:hypothetical protein